MLAVLAAEGLARDAPRGAADAMGFAAQEPRASEDAEEAGCADRAVRAPVRVSHKTLLALSLHSIDEHRMIHRMSSGSAGLKDQKDLEDEEEVSEALLFPGRRLRRFGSARLGGSPDVTCHNQKTLAHSESSASSLTFDDASEISAGDGNAAASCVDADVTTSRQKVWLLENRLDRSLRRRDSQAITHCLSQREIIHVNQAMVAAATEALHQLGNKKQTALSNHPQRW